jgi:hypothetical protein
VTWSYRIETSGVDFDHTQCERQRQGDQRRSLEMGLAQARYQPNWQSGAMRPSTRVSVWWLARKRESRLLPANSDLLGFSADRSPP